MSWVDLAGLVLVLWCGASGYLAGVYRAFLHLCAVFVSLLIAVLLQGSLLVYLRQEWQAEAVLAGILAKYVEKPLAAGGTAAASFPAPRMLLLLKQRMSPGYSMPVSGGGDAAISGLTDLLLWGITIFILFLLIACIFIVAFRVLKLRGQYKPRQEWQRLGGLLLGSVLGLVLCVIVCLVLDVICCAAWLAFLQQDLNNSYLYMVSAQIAQFSLLK